MRGLIRRCPGYRTQRASCPRSRLLSTSVMHYVGSTRRTARSTQTRRMPPVMRWRCYRRTLTVRERARSSSTAQQRPFLLFTQRSHISLPFPSPTAEELEEPDEELNELLTSQGAESIKQAAELDALKTKVTEIEGEIARAERKRDDARATLEQQKAEEAHHKKTEEDALLLIDDLDGEYGIKTSTAAATGREPPAYKAKAATEALSRVLQSRQAELAQAKDKRQHYSSTQGTKVQQLRVKIDHTSEAATQKEKEAADHQMRLRNLQQRVEGLLEDTDGLVSPKHGTIPSICS